MPPTQTCSACRGRKVRCDGVLPMCGPCSKARKPMECLYTTATAVASTPKGEYLKKGAACVPCRRKKKKCDAQRPYCTTCKIAGKERECAYDENVERTLTEVLFLRTHILEQRLAAYEGQSGPFVSPEQMSPDGYHSTASSSRIPTPHLQPQNVYDIPMYNFPQALNVLFDRMAAPPPTMDLYSLSTQHIPQELDEFRSVYALHARQYGCVLSAEKMQAVIIGDLSGTVVHPAFIYMAQLLGCLLWQNARQTCLYQKVETEQMQLLFAALSDADPVTEIQVRYLLAIYFLLKQQMDDGDTQLMLAAEIVRHNRLSFPTTVETYNPLALHDATPEQTELIGALSHLIYLDRASSFVFRVPMRLDKGFDEALKNVSVYYPILSKTNLSYLRARSLILYIRVTELGVQWASINASAASGVFSAARPAWFEAYWPLLEEITTHSSNLEIQMLKASFYGEREQAIALKMCLVVSLAAKAQMHWLTQHGYPESGQRALDVVMEVVGISQTFKDNEFLLLDPVLGVCWSAVAKIVLEAMKGSLLPVGKSEISWNSALQTIDTSAKKLGYQVPFMEESLQEISDVIRVVEVSP